LDTGALKYAGVCDKENDFGRLGLKASVDSGSKKRMNITENNKTYQFRPDWWREDLDLMQV
jgi:hypothetical protein